MSKILCDGKYNGYYIEASQEAYDLLVADGYIPQSSMTKELPRFKYYIIQDCIICGTCDEVVDNAEYEEIHLYIVDGKLSATQYHPDEVSFSAIYHGNIPEKATYSQSANENTKKQIEELYLDCDKGDLADAFTVTEATVFPKKEKLSGDFASKVYELTYGIAEMLISKNEKYGNSALQPKRIFSKMDSIEQLYVRIDDKLSRISNQNLNDDEDVIEDLIGYLILLKIAKS